MSTDTAKWIWVAIASWNLIVALINLGAGEYGDAWHLFVIAVLSANIAWLTSLLQLAQEDIKALRDPLYRRDAS